jgi:16S rRNA C1402 (ribose-2'-O) methylase RsmI
VVLAREITKKFENYMRGRPAELAQALAGRSLKGEFVVLVAEAEGSDPKLGEEAGGSGSEPIEEAESQDSQPAGEGPVPESLSAFPGQPPSRP